MVKKNSNTVALRKVNIETWKSPVAKQFSLRGIPYFIITDGNGKIVDKGNQSLLQKYGRLFAK